MNKNTLMMQKIIFAYHPLFKTDLKLQTYALNDTEIFNVERLVEQSMAEASCGAYDFIDGSHEDFSDGTECKTASIRQNASKSSSANCNTHNGEISNVSTAGGNQKSGAIRCVIYNPHFHELQYYFIPKSWWAYNVTRHPTTGVGKIVFSYNRSNNTIAKLDKFKVLDFSTLATEK